MAFRGYRNGVLQFEQTEDISSPAIEKVVPAIAAEHAAFLIGPEPWLMEVEFLDESDSERRFFRLGSDHSMMGKPVSVDPAKGIDWSRWKG